MKRRKYICVTPLSWIYRISMLVLAVSSSEPRITGCELLEHANITCYWTAPSSENITYMMQVTKHNCMNKKISTDSCNTTYTQCSVKIGSVSHCFCVDVFTSSMSASLQSYCFNGINQVMLYTPHITTLATLPEKASCLKLEWKDTQSEYVKSERNLRILQIEYRTPQQTDFPEVTAFLHDWHTDMCGLHPGTKYMVRVRAQDLRAKHHWSSWSGFAEATTAEAAIMATPELWRHIQPVDRSGQRCITLLWKPLQWPHTNGIILGYGASCWNDLDSSYWDCGHLDSSSTSCTLHVSAHPCNCNLTASNSVGLSPAAHIYIPGDMDTELPAPESISVSALDDFQLKVEWKATVNQSETSFVVQWFPIPDTTAVGLDWKFLKGSEASFIITELHPGIPYNVSVRSLYNNTAGAERFAIAFTRQGAPSAGPKLEVLQTTNNDVTLKWYPVPLEKLHGFVQNYTVIYKYNGKVKSRVLKGSTELFTVNNLSPGQYTMCVRAHTLAGSADSTWIMVTVGTVHIPVMAIVLCTMASLVIIFILLSQAERIEQCVCPVVPNPSKSSLSTWPPVHQHKVPIGDSPALIKPVCIDETVNHNPQHLLTFIKQTTKNQVCERVLLEAEQTFSDQTAQETLSEALITDLSYRNTVMETPLCYQCVSSSCPEVPDLERMTVDSVFCKSNIVRRLVSSYERLESVSAPHVSCDFPLHSCLRVDTMDPHDLGCKSCTVTKLKTHFNKHVSTSYLSVSDSCIDVRSLAENSTNLIRISKHLSRLESGCYSHVSASNLLVPELSPADYVTISTAVDFPQSNQMPKKATHGYLHISTSYLPLPVPSHSEAEFANNFHTNYSMSGLKSCIRNNVHISCQESCLDFEVEEAYKSLNTVHSDALNLNMN